MHLFVQTGSYSAEEVFHLVLIWATMAAPANRPTTELLRPSRNLCMSAFFGYYRTTTPLLSASGVSLIDIPILLLDQSTHVKTLLVGWTLGF